jgi:hypothetical protein
MAPALKQALKRVVGDERDAREEEDDFTTLDERSSSVRLRLRLRRGPSIEKSVDSFFV